MTRPDDECPYPRPFPADFDSCPAFQARLKGLIPAIVYGGSGNPENVAVDSRTLERHVEQGHFLTTLLMLDVAGKKFQDNFVAEFFTSLAYSRMKDFTNAVNHLTAAEVILGGGCGGRRSFKRSIRSWSSGSGWV